jgi:hypothetical protein
MKYIAVNSEKREDQKHLFEVHVGKTILASHYGLYVKGPSSLLYEIIPSIKPHKFVSIHTQSDVVTYMSYNKIPTMKKIIHVEHQNIGKYNLPVLSIIEDDNRIYCSNIELSGPCVLKYNKECPRVSGISCWIETDDPIKILS